MGTVCFDFDSTLIPGESLELVLRRSPALDATTRRAIEALTRAGMAGEITFQRSLEERLALARPHRDALVAVAAQLAAAPTAGAQALIARLHADGHAVYVVSGGLHDLIVPVAASLGVAPSRVHGVRCHWAPDGRLEGLDDESAFRVSKIAGLRQAEVDWAGPSVVVGDGATDLALRDAGLVQHFVAYTEHACRAAVVDRADATAASMRALAERLVPLLEGPP